MKINNKSIDELSVLALEEVMEVIAKKLELKKRNEMIADKIRLVNKTLEELGELGLPFELSDNFETLGSFTFDEDFDLVYDKDRDSLVFQYYG